MLPGQENVSQVDFLVNTFHWALSGTEPFRRCLERLEERVDMSSLLGRLRHVHEKRIRASANRIQADHKLHIVHLRVVIEIRVQPLFRALEVQQVVGFCD